MRENEKVHHLSRLIAPALKVLFNSLNMLKSMFSKDQKNITVLKGRP
jgi:hypothetical protein